MTSPEPLSASDKPDLGDEPSSPELQLSAAAAAALQEFFSDQQQQSETDPFSANFGLSQVIGKQLLKRTNLS